MIDSQEAIGMQETNAVETDIVPQWILYEGTD